MAQESLLNSLDNDKEAIEYGLHLQEHQQLVVAGRFEKYVEFAGAVRDWAKTTTEGVAASEMLGLLKKVEE